jgi:hypothetical protein
MAVATSNPELLLMLVEEKNLAAAEERQENEQCSAGIRRALRSSAEPRCVLGALRRLGVFGVALETTQRRAFQLRIA